MRKLIRRAPSPAMVVACIALLVALGGTSIAAADQLGRGSVGTRQLKNKAVTTAKIRNNAVTSAKVRNRSLLRVDFAPGQLPAGPVGPQGPIGPQGPAGPAGPAGAAGTIGAITVRSSSVAISDGAHDDQSYGIGQTQALCSSGELAASGGANWSDTDTGHVLILGRLLPVLNTSNQVTGFRAWGLNDSGESSTFTVYSLCYKAS